MRIHSPTLPLLSLLLFAAPQARADVLGYELPGVTAADWWYGCSATAGGMLAAYYDTSGYKGHSYSNLVPGGTASAAIGAWPTGSLLRGVIASEGHQRDYYNAGTYGYNNGGDGYYDSAHVWQTYGCGDSGDDIATTRSYDCVADFMGTSQDAHDNVNGATQCYFDDTGARHTYGDSSLVDMGEGIGLVRDMATGIRDYIEYCGYAVASLFSQYCDVWCDAKSLANNGFTYADYCAEIDAGRVVLVAIQSDTAGHAMLGIGYDKATESILFKNTWWEETGRMAWDGQYYGLSMSGVVCLELAAPVPEPSDYALGAGVLMLLVAAARRKISVRNP